MTGSSGDAEAIVIRRRIAASRDDVFDAWTDATGMRLWMCPGDIVSADVHLEVARDTRWRNGGGLINRGRAFVGRHQRETHKRENFL